MRNRDEWGYYETSPDQAAYESFHEDMQRLIRERDAALAWARRWKDAAHTLNRRWRVERDACVVSRRVWAFHRKTLGTQLRNARETIDDMLEMLAHNAEADGR